MGYRVRWFRRRHRIVATLMLAAFLTSLPLRATAQTGGISSAAYSLLSERVGGNQTSFFVYQDGDSGFNHGFLSGFFGNALGKIHLDAFCINDPSSATGCSTDTNRLDRTRGTVLRISIDPLGAGQYAGV